MLLACCCNQEVGSIGGLYPIRYSIVVWRINGRAPGERQKLVASTVQIFYEWTACWRRDGGQQQAVKAYAGLVHHLLTLHPLGDRPTPVVLVLRQAAHSLSNRGLSYFVMPQANIEGVRGGFDGFDGGFKGIGVPSELPSSTPGELPALSSRSAQSSETLFNACSVRLVPIVLRLCMIFNATSFRGQQRSLCPPANARFQHRSQRVACFYEDEQRV